MGSVIYINGKARAASPGTLREVRQATERAKQPYLPYAAGNFEVLYDAKGTPKKIEMAPRPDVEERIVDVIQPRKKIPGELMYDPEEGITYRIVKNLDMKDFWMSTAFYQERWKLEHQDVLKFVRLGMMEAAVEAGSDYRLYRVHDERLLMASDAFKVARRRFAQAKYKASIARKQGR